MKALQSLPEKKQLLDQMNLHGAEPAAALLRALGNPNRLMILCSLVNGEQSVGQLNERVPLSQSALSQHLALLRRENLVATRREAQTIYYRIAEPVVLEVIETLYRRFCANPGQPSGRPASGPIKRR